MKEKLSAIYEKIEDFVEDHDTMITSSVYVTFLVITGVCLMHKTRLESKIMKLQLQELKK